MTSSHASSVVPAEEADAHLWEPPYIGKINTVDLEPEYHIPTAAEVEEIEREAREAGHRSGFDQGYQEGTQQAQQEAEQARQKWQKQEAAKLSATVAALEAVAGALADPLANAAESIEPELLALAIALAQRVIQAELTTREELIQAVLQQALDHLPSRKHSLTVRVHPEDQAVLERYAKKQGENVTWVADPTLSRGGCVVDSGSSHIDARLETRLQQNVDALWGDLEINMSPADD